MGGPGRATGAKGAVPLPYYLLAALGLCCCAQVFSNFGECGLLSSCSGFSCRARALSAWVSVLEAHRL